MTEEKELKRMRERPRQGQQPPSPRETWLEMNHPVGWWDQSHF